jgi:uroporphyrinogen decarboxylase
MALMAKRERVLRTARFEETDRVPLYDILQNDGVIEYYAGEKPTVENGDRTVALAVGRSLDMTRMISAPNQPGIHHQEDGLVIQVERWTSWITERPFKNLPEARNWVQTRIQEANKIQFATSTREHHEAHVRKLLGWFAEGDPTGRHDPTVFVVESGAGLTQIYWSLGMDLFVEMLVEDPELIEEWLEANNQLELRRVAAIANPDLVPIVLTYDDVAHKTGTLFSPAWLRKLWIPRLKSLVKAWHERDTLCLFHSDGNLWGILDDLVGAGIEGLNPLETLADMTVKKVRQKYPHLFLAGGIDVSQLLPLGTPEEVRAVCLEAIKDTQGRGFFMGSTTELHWEIPLENVRTMFETVMF